MDIVWLSEIKWDYLRTRKQQLIRRKPGDCRLLFLEPYALGCKNDFAIREVDNILIATVPFLKPPPPRIPIRKLLQPTSIRNLVHWNASRTVRRLMHRAGFEANETGCILSNVHALPVAQRIACAFIGYDCNDAHAAFPSRPTWTRTYYEETCRIADAIFASSTSLVEAAHRIRGNANGISLVGNGVDCSLFEEARSRLGAYEPPSTVRIGYLGAIAPWFDFAAVEEIATAHPEWEMALIGPVASGSQKDVRHLARLPNVSVQAPVAHADVPQILQNFTVGLIPFQSNELTRGVNPNKMYEYLAMGIPTVATRFSQEVDLHPDLVRTVTCGQSLVEACEAFVTMVQRPEEREAFRTKAFKLARRHDWDAIAERFWETIRKLFHRG